MKRFGPPEPSPAAEPKSPAEQPPLWAVTVCVRAVGGETLAQLELSPEATGADAKSEIRRLAQIPEPQQRLLCGGAMWCDEEALPRKEAEEGGVTLLLLQTLTIAVRDFDDGRPLATLDLDFEATVSDAKEEIEVRTDIPYGDQRLTCAGVRLKASQLLADTLAPTVGLQMEVERYMCMHERLRMDAGHTPKHTPRHMPKHTPRHTKT